MSGPAGPVTPAARRRDLIALGVVAVGALVFVVSSLQLRGMAQGEGMIRGPERSQRNMARAVRLVRVSQGGVALIVAGVLTAAWSFARHATSKPSTAHGQEDRT